MSKRIVLSVLAIVLLHFFTLSAARAEEHTETAFEARIEQVIEQLKGQMKLEGGFDADRFKQLGQVLQTLKADNESHREFLDDVARFAEGDVPERMFLAYLDQILPEFGEADAAATEALLPEYTDTRSLEELKAAVERGDNGMLWRLRTGCPWRDLPERYGPWQSVYDRFNRWSRDGTLQAIAEVLLVELDNAEAIDWDLWHIDGSSIRATRAAAGAAASASKKDPTSRKTTPWAAAEADSAASCT